MPWRSFCTLFLLLLTFTHTVFGLQHFASVRVFARIFDRSCHRHFDFAPMDLQKGSHFQASTLTFLQLLSLQFSFDILGKRGAKKFCLRQRRTEVEFGTAWKWARSCLSWAERARTQATKAVCPIHSASHVLNCVHLIDFLEYWCQF